MQLTSHPRLSIDPSPYDGHLVPPSWPFQHTPLNYLPVQWLSPVVTPPCPHCPLESAGHEGETHAVDGKDGSIPCQHHWGDPGNKGCQMPWARECLEGVVVFGHWLFLLFTQQLCKKCQGAFGLLVWLTRCSRRMAVEGSQAWSSLLLGESSKTGLVLGGIFI